MEKKSKSPKTGPVRKIKARYIQLEIPYPPPTPEDRRNSVRAILAAWRIGSLETAKMTRQIRIKRAAPDEDRGI
jgi:hypothetical protein